jgi:GAF domain-containing protein
MSPPIDTTAGLIVEQTGVHSCAITLLGRPVQGSDRTAADLEDWQFVLADGPAVAASNSAAPVEYPDVDTILDHCPRLGPHLTEAGVGSVAAFPIMLGSRCVGTITLYSTTQPLRQHQRRCAERWARQLSEAIEVDPDAWADTRVAVTPDFDIAVGRVMVSSHVDPTAAELVIRAHSFATAVSLRDLCHRIVHDDLSLEVEPV